MLIQPRIIIIAAALAISFGAGWLFNGWRLDSRYSELLAQQATDHANAQLQARSEEQRRQTALEGIRHAAAQDIAKAQADAAAANAAADSLRARLDKFARTAARYTGTIAGSKAATDPVRVLADMFIELERHGREIAAEADRRRIAGLACEKSYEALKND